MLPRGRSVHNSQLAAKDGANERKDPKSGYYLWGVRGPSALQRCTSPLDSGTDSNFLLELLHSIEINIQRDGESLLNIPKRTKDDHRAADKVGLVMCAILFTNYSYGFRSALSDLSGFSESYPPALLSDVHILSTPCDMLYVVICQSRSGASNPSSL